MSDLYDQFQDQSLLIKSAQWQKDSHGLFDYEMRQIVRSSYKINSSKMCIRNDQGLKFEDLDTDVKEKFSETAQQLFKVHKIRNKYFIEGMEPINPKDDIDDFYLEAGEPTLPAVEMRERMYNVVRFIQFKNEVGL